MSYKNFRKFVRFLYRSGQRQQKCSPVKKIQIVSMERWISLDGKRLEILQFNFDNALSKQDQRFSAQNIPKLTTLIMKDFFPTAFNIYFPTSAVMKENDLQD